MHHAVDSGTDPLARWLAVYEAPPERKLLKAFKVAGENLWPAIVRSGLGGDTYARCVLTSHALVDFLSMMGFEARVIPALLDVSHRGADLSIQGSTLGIGEPNEKAGTAGLHVVTEVFGEDGRQWIIDGAVRQAARAGRWRQPPEVVVAETFVVIPAMDPADPLALLGFHPLAAVAIDQRDGTDLRLQWLTNPSHPDQWTGTPDAEPARSNELAKRLKVAWQRMKK